MPGCADFSGQGWAAGRIRSRTGATLKRAEALLKEKHIVLPPEAAPVANFVNAVRVGNLLFMAGNTGGPQ
jgi:hypothetical protein